MRWLTWPWRWLVTRWDAADSRLANPFGDLDD